MKTLQDALDAVFPQTAVENCNNETLREMSERAHDMVERYRPTTSELDDNPTFVALTRTLRQMVAANLISPDEALSEAFKVGLTVGIEMEK